MFPEQDTPGRLAVYEAEPGTVVAVLSGSLDLACVKDLEDPLEAVLRERRPRVLAFDMGAVDFCDCATLRALLRVRADGRRCGSRVVISEASETVAWLLELFQLDRLFGYPAAERPVRPGPGVVGESSG